MHRTFQSSNESGICIDAQFDELQMHWCVLLTGAFLLSEHNIQAGRVLRCGIALFGLCVSAVLNCFCAIFQLGGRP